MVRHDGLFWRRFANLGCVHAPEWFKTYSPPWFGTAIFALVGRNRAGATENMHRILGTDSSLRAHLAALRMFQEFSRCFSETLENYGPQPPPVRIDQPKDDVLATSLRDGLGAILVTAHFGNWDIAAKALSQYGRTVNAVMGREANATSRDFLRAAREHSGLRVIYSDSSAFSAFNMLHALRRNEVVAIQLDRNGTTEATRLVPFFGAPAPFALGPFALARLAQAPIIPVFVRASAAATTPSGSAAASASRATLATTGSRPSCAEWSGSSSRWCASFPRNGSSSHRSGRSSRPSRRSSARPTKKFSTSASAHSAYSLPETRDPTRDAARLARAQR
jgi:KDO2-lipid IV(A) lauroyltransferase